MLLLNFSHPITPEQMAQIEQLAGQPIQQTVNLAVQFDHQQPFLPQLQALVEQLPLSAEQIQTTPILVNPPSLNFITAMLLAELHGRLGYFPAMLRIRPLEGSLPPRFEAAEIINLQQIRDRARKERY